MAGVKLGMKPLNPDPNRQDFPEGEGQDESNPENLQPENLTGNAMDAIQAAETNSATGQSSEQADEESSQTGAAESGDSSSPETVQQSVEDELGEVSPMLPVEKLQLGDLVILDDLRYTCALPAVEIKEGVFTATSLRHTLNGTFRDVVQGRKVKLVNRPPRSK